jgi:hypothetical protein
MDTVHQPSFISCSSVRLLLLAAFKETRAQSCSVVARERRRALASAPQLCLVFGPNWTTFGLRLPVIAPPPILPVRPSARLVRGTEASPPHSSSGSLTSWSLQPMPLRFQLRSLARDFPTQILTRRVVGREPLSHATVMRDSASWYKY